MGKSKKKKNTKSLLEYVEKEFKFHVSHIKCRNEKLKQFLRVLESYDIVLAEGPAGTSKTYTAVYTALKALEKNQVELIILIKPNIEVAGFELGFLPGSAEDKVDPYYYSFYDQIDQMVGESTRKALIQSGKIKLIPIGLCRGRTFKNSYCLIDEIQNCNYDAFKTLITRIGEGSKYVLLGDSGLIDFKHKEVSVLTKIINLFKDDPEIGTFTFTDSDVVRHPLITYILRRLQTLE